VSNYTDDLVKKWEIEDPRDCHKHKVLPFGPIPGERVEVIEPEASREPPEFKRTNTNDLMAATFQPLKAIVSGYVYGGFAVLAGRQKLGKTWLAIDWAVAIATGGVALGSIDCVPGDVFISTWRMVRVAFRLGSGRFSPITTHYRICRGSNGSRKRRS
jgi:hypothetical protein